MKFRITRPVRATITYEVEITEAQGREMDQLGDDESNSPEMLRDYALGADTPDLHVGLNGGVSAPAGVRLRLSDDPIDYASTPDVEVIE